MLKKEGYFTTHACSARISWKISEDPDGTKVVTLQLGTKEIDFSRDRQIFEHSDLEDLITMLSIIKQEIDSSKQLDLFQAFANYNGPEISGPITSPTGSVKDTIKERK